MIFMRKNLFVLLACALLLLIAAAPAVAAEDIKLQINSETVPAPNLYLAEDAYTMVSTDAFIKLIGADVIRSDDNSFAINENGRVLNLTVGQTEAWLGEEQLVLPTAPVQTEGNLFIPLRAVSDAFDFNVDWDEQQWLVALTRTEQRDDMTAFDLFVKSSLASLEYNTYAMNGVTNVSFNITMNGQAVPELPQNISMNITGQVQNDPLQAYAKTTPIGSTFTELTSETYMTQDKMYVKTDEEWLVVDVPFMAELWQQQQDIQSNPLKAAEQLKEFGFLANFGNDVTINGQEYYVVNARMDMAKLQESLPQMFQQMLPAEQFSEDDLTTLTQEMQEVFNGMTIDFNYTVMINKENLICEIVEYDMQMSLTVEEPNPESGEQQVVNMDIQANGTINVTDLNAPFNAPDVSNARTMESYMEETMSEGLDETAATEENADASAETETAADEDEEAAVTDEDVADENLDDATDAEQETEE